jgi:hypothetical membrane protein
MSFKNWYKPLFVFVAAFALLVGYTYFVKHDSPFDFYAWVCYIADFVTALILAIAAKKGTQATSHLGNKE